MIDSFVSSPPDREQTLLTDGWLGLRPIGPADTQDLFEASLESIAEVSQWLPWCHPDYQVKESAEWTARAAELWKRGLEFQFAIRDRKTERYLGGCGLNHINPIHGFANLGYWVRSSAAGQGVASAAAILVARFGLEELELQRIEIVTDVSNAPSQRVAEKLGATREGVARQRLRLHGKPSDAVMFSLVLSDLRPTSPAR